LAIRVFPTTNDIGGSGTGKTIKEQSLAKLMRVVRGLMPGENPGFWYYPDTSVSQLPASSVTLSFTLPAYTAMVNGSMVDDASSQTITMPPSTTRYLVLSLTRDGSGNVNGAALALGTSMATTYDQLDLCTIYSATSTITQITDTRKLSKFSGTAGYSSGHNHSGSNGQGPKIPTGSLDISNTFTQPFHTQTTGCGFFNGAKIGGAGPGIALNWDGSYYIGLGQHAADTANNVRLGISNMDLATWYAGNLDLWLGPSRKVIHTDDTVTGNNANGYYIKFPDGTMINYTHITAMSFSGAWTYPCAFPNGLVSVTATSAWEAGSPWQATSHIIVPGLTIATIYGYSAMGTSAQSTYPAAMNVMAMGRWK
jgi:hypothetical protein